MAPVAITGTKKFRNYIGGEWVDADGGETFESIVPATGDAIGEFPRSTPEDVDRAVAAAKAAYEDWRLTPAPKRAEVLYRFANLLVEHKDDLADLMSREMGKVMVEAAGDVQEAIDMTLYMAGEGRRMFGQTTPSELPNKFQMSVRMPIGVVGVITPWNFPIAIPSWKIAPALVCGNTVVFKPAEDTPLLAERFVELLEESGLPAGVVNVVHGYGEEVGEAIVKHPDVPVITFTGSRETGVRGDAHGGGPAEARAPRARRQERDRRHGRREPRPRRRRDRLVGVRNVGPALHGREPDRRARARSTTSSSRGSSPRRSRCGSVRAGSRRPTSAR